MTPAADRPPLPVEPPYTLAVVSELLGYTVGYIRKLLSVHRAQFPVRRYRVGRKAHALRVRWLTGDEVRLLRKLSAPVKSQSDPPRP